MAERALVARPGALGFRHVKTIRHNSNITITHYKEAHMKNLSIPLALASAALMLLASPAPAQEQAPAPTNIYVSSTQHMRMPDGGRMAERDSLLLLYHEQVTMKNPLILSQRVMRHYYGANSLDMVFINEYKDWASIEAAGKKDDELFEKYWADQAARRQYNQMIGKYFSNHADEIYSDHPKLRK